MLDVEDWAKIRRLRWSEGMSISQIARVVGLARKTVKPALMSESPPSPRQGIRLSSWLAPTARVGARDRWCTMSGLVCDVMTREVLVARPETTFRELVRLIEDHHVHALPVVDELGRVLGVVAESDLLKEGLTEEHVRTFLQRRGRVRPAGTMAGDMMTSPAVTIDSLQSLSQAARVLHQRHLGRLPVVEHDGRLIGIVTRSDLLTVFLRTDEDLLVAVQEAIAAVDDSPSPTISATVDDGVVVLQGSAPLLSQLMVVGDRVRRVPGIVHLDVKATAAIDDVHPAMASSSPSSGSTPPSAPFPTTTDYRITQKTEQ